MILYILKMEVIDLGAGDGTAHFTTNASSINGNTGTDEAIVDI